MAERTVDKAKLYATLYNAYLAAYPKKSKQICQQEFNVKWTELKKGEGLEDKVAALLRELKSVELKNKGSLLTFWSKQTALAPLSATLVLFAPPLQVQLATKSKMRLTTHH